MLILQTSFAQKTEVNWEFENKFVKNQRNQNIIGENDDFLFTFNLRPKGLFRKETFSFLKFNKKDYKLNKTISFKLPKRKVESLSYNSSMMVEDQVRL